MLGFDLDIWDYLTFLVLTIAGLVALVWLAGLPGRIAIARNHPLLGSDHLVLVTCRTQPDETKVLYRAQGITPKLGFYEPLQVSV